MATVDNVYQAIQFIVNKQQTGNATPARINIAQDIGNRLLFKRYSGIPEQWQPGMPVSKMAFSINSDIEKVMRLFKETKDLYINDQGVATVPSDFIKESTLTYITIKDGQKEYVPVDICNDVEFAERRNSYVVRADKDNPACIFKKTFIEFAPLDLVNVQMVYLRMVRTPVWGFTLTNGRPVYDSSTSVDPEWPDDIINDFIMLTVQQLGINMQRSQLVQEMESFKEKGQ